ncbi:MAG: hypothetical protein M5U26_22175 [Planctomycetota bacterium]|nr:hypothetical protein [Planctomycetota bacterium]
MTTVSPAKPAWDFTLLLERLFWGTVSIVFAVPLFLLVDALGLGGSTEEAALACFLVLAWTGADALCRRSWKALALALPVGWAVLILSSSFRMYRGWELLAPALGSALGLGVVVWRLDGSKFFGAAVALLSGLYTLDVYALVRHFALGNDVFFMAAGGVMHGAAGAVLMVYCRLLGKTSSRRIRFSLGAAVLFVFLLAGEVAGFFALGYGDVFLPFDEARFKAQGNRQRRRWRPENTGRRPMRPFGAWHTWHVVRAEAMKT